MKKIIQQKLADAVSMELPELTEREYGIPNIKNKVYTVIGMRRAGKTYFLYSIMKKFIKNGVDKSKLVYFNFEDERLADMTVKDLHIICDEYYIMFPENRSVTVNFFFDEIQLVQGWETFIRRILDSENVKIHISGSSAKMLSKEIASSMRGRSIDITIYPYSFNETLKNDNIILPASLLLINKKSRSTIENRFLKYLFAGGFPEIENLAEQDRHIILQGYVNTIIFRDIVERYNVSNITALKRLIRHIIYNTASLFTVNKFYNQIKSEGIKASKNTIHRYIEYLKDAFFLHTVPLYDESLRKQMVNPQKIYITDSGISNAYFIRQRANTGRLLENSVFMELLRRNAKVFYIKKRQGYEVDFLAFFPDGSVHAIQVAADIDNSETLERETRALSGVLEIAPDASLSLINLSEERSIERDNLKIDIIPAWKWMLDKI